MAAVRSVAEERVLLLVSTRRDRDVSAQLLGRAGLRTRTCETARQLAIEIGRGAAAVLATDTMMELSCVEELMQQLERQEEWSDLPFVVLMRGGAASPRAVEILQRLTNVTILDRPAGLRSVLSAVQAAVRGRWRQYEARTLITSLRAAEGKAREVDQAKDRFLATLSHELRTPLTPVLILADESIADLELPARVREQFQMVQKSVELEVRLIDDLLDHSRIVQGKLSLRLEPLDAAEVLREAVEIVRGKAEEKAIALQGHFAAQRTCVNADAVRLQQIFLNLLTNAIKFTPSGGSVSVETSNPESSGTMEVRMADTGPGLAAEELARVFEPFYQTGVGRVARSAEGGGLGLGLAIAQSLAVRQGGAIRAESRGVGCGATFIVELPVAVTAAALPASVAARLEVPGAGITWRILLVEDHAATRRALEQMLARRGHRVVSAGSKHDAMAVASSATFDLLISDVGLPDGDGTELLAELRRIQPGLQGIALSGYGMENDVQRSSLGGYAAHLVKPVPVARLQAAIAQLQSHLAET